MASKHSVTELMRKKNFTINGLAEQSGVSEPTVRRAVRGDGQARVNTSSAERLAKALGSPIGEINWPGGLANEGRPAGPGGSHTPRSD
jgi:transcriptional regulator with XRE-family HTH domain